MEKQKERNVNYSNEEAGITLIALVITIIVLLILAGVSLSLVVGENGILSKATSAATQSKKSQLEEEVQLLLADWQADYLTNGTSYEGRSETTSSGAVVTCIGDSILVANGAETYTASFNNGQVGELTKQELVEDSQAYKAMHPTVPTGFTHITGEWNTGYVIQEDLTKDEFVWIPVVSEASYAKKNSSRNYGMEKQGADEIGKDVLAFIRGDVIGLGTILGTNVTQTLPNDKPEAIIVNAAGGFYVSRYEIGIKERKTLATGNQAEADWTKVNLVSQAGKEPARNISQQKSLEVANSWKSGTDYQSGLITGTEWDVMCNFMGWLRCDSDCTIWGNYRNSLSKEYNNIEIGNCTADTNYGAEAGKWVTMTTWKRISDILSTRNVFQTGKFENVDGIKTDIKNIYDVAGNICEWTTEVPLNSKDTPIDGHRVLRGGSVTVNGFDYIATIRRGSDWMGNANPDVGFRVVLYVK